MDIQTQEIEKKLVWNYKIGNIKCIFQVRQCSIWEVMLTFAQPLKPIWTHICPSLQSNPSINCTTWSDFLPIEYVLEMY